MDFRSISFIKTIIAKLKFDNIKTYRADTFKIIYTVGDIIPGEVLNIGNPNCRVKINQPIHEFFDKWCQQGPSHHIALGYGDLSEEIESFAGAMKFDVVRL